MYQGTPKHEYVVTPMPDGTFRVWNEPKDSNYLVYRSPKGKWRCTCPHYEFRCKKWGTHCKHIELAKREETNNDNNSRRTNIFSQTLATAQVNSL